MEGLSSLPLYRPPMVQLRKSTAGICTSSSRCDDALPPTNLLEIASSVPASSASKHATTPSKALTIARSMSRFVNPHLFRLTHLLSIYDLASLKRKNVLSS